MTYLITAGGILAVAYVVRLAWEVWTTLTRLVELDELRREANE